jgi:protein-S-isoprenylcysteine O-methyltransferase Ste14
MFIRALMAFLILPFLVAGLIPLILSSLDPWRGHGFIFPGIPVAGLGLIVLLWCVRDFYVSGKGTLAPWDPPKHLVIVGLYRYSRNPMYIGVLTLIGGWAILSASPLISCYLLLFTVIFHLRVIHFEEPCLSKKFGNEWTAYCAITSRWLPGL